MEETRMSWSHRWNRLLFAGLLMFAGNGGPSAMAQEGPQGVARMPSPTLPPSAADGEPAPVPLIGTDEPDLTPPAAPPAPVGCTCGNRRGLSRWRWHRAHCKRHLQDHFLGYAEEFNEWPLGESAYAHARTQVANGQAARMVFHHCDFVDGTSQLNMRGRDKLAAVTASLPTNFFPIVVERTPREPGLDESRRTVLLAEIARGPFPVPAERILIGPSIANGMTGFEADRIYWARQIPNLQSGGAIGSSGAGSFVGGGMGFDSSGLSGGAVTGLGPIGR
jgi:hypothetical protein